MEQNSTPEVAMPAPEETQLSNSNSKISKDSHWITILSMALFVLLSLGAVAFLYYQNQQLKSMLTSYQSQSFPTPTASSDPSAKWKTYTSTKYNFSFKYPQESTITKDLLDVDGSVEFENFVLFFEKTNDTLTNYVNKLKETNIAFTQITKNIGDVSTTEWVGLYKNAPTQYISFIQNGYAYNFGVTPYEAANTENNSKILTQILSTFKFLETSPIPSAKACTQEAKICPDGSSVGRTGPNCEFTPCP